MALKTYTGSCHCGALQFEIDADLSKGTEKCNCTICTKMRLWSVRVSSNEFRLISGEEFLSDYTYGSGNAHHTFCRRCGVRPFEHINWPSDVVYYNISVACLDGVDINELMAAPVDYQDGLHDSWEQVPDEIRHL